MSYDGNRRARWVDCPWVPKAIRNKTTAKKIELLNELAQSLLSQHAAADQFKTFRGRPITDEQREQLKRRGY